MPGANLGNFAEAKNSVIGERVQMHHFSYMGDANVGADTNVGAGTITMNWDGKVKHPTTIGKRVFLGCDTLLRAPVTIGDGATTGGGSVVTRDVAPGALVVGAPARVAPRVRSQGQMTPEANETSANETPASDSAGSSGDTPNTAPTSPGGKRE
jgi:bifunctional UDP-N-acetylglucosamine pyrophosphorylase/glucosamine-1-phosphate N-acetyltransferase